VLVVDIGNDTAQTTRTISFRPAIGDVLYTAKPLTTVLAAAAAADAHDLNSTLRFLHSSFTKQPRTNRPLTQLQSATEFFLLAHTGALQVRLLLLLLLLFLPSVLHENQQCCDSKRLL